MLFSSITKRRLLVLVFVLTAIMHDHAYAFATDSTDELKDKLWQYVSERPSTNLFVHTDKNIYTPNERIWFKAYVLSGTVTDNKVLYVRLADEKKNIALSAQFPFYGLLSHGDILLPDTLKDGKYFLYAYGDRMINFNSRDVFVQPVIIHKNRKKWRAEVSVVDTSKLVRGEKVELLVRLKQNNDLVKNVRGRYQLMNGTKTVKQGGLKTNIVGEAFIPFTYPDIPDDQTLNAVIVFEDDKDYEEVTINLRHRGNTLHVNAYPQGGHLVNNIANKINVCITDVSNQAVACQVKLLTGDNILQSVKSDNSGIAVLDFIPLAGKNYLLELDNNGRSQVVPLKLPVDDAGFNLNGTVEGDNLHITINSNTGSDDLILLLRTFDDVVWSRKISVIPGREFLTDIPLDSLRRQVMSISLAGTGNVVYAEQLFINRETEDMRVEIKTDKQVYGVRKKVTVSINTQNRKGEPVGSDLSVAAGEVNTIDSAIFPNIINAGLFRNIGFKNEYQLSHKTKLPELNNILITKTWNNYDWDWIMNYNPTGELRVYKNTDGVYGTILPLKKKKGIKIKELPILSSSGIQYAAVSDAGIFDIPSEELLSAKNERKKLLLGMDFYDNYSINIKPYDKDFDKLTTKTNVFDFPQQFTKLSKYRMEKLEKLTDPHQLQNVVVKYTKELPWDAKEYTSSNCTDYVCMYNIFNCPNHHIGTPPIVGEIYMFKGQRIIYRGCGQSTEETRPVIPLKMISVPNAFQVIDFEKEQSAEPETRTTVYWNANIITGKDGVATFSFFTDDVTGEFKIIVQGVSIKGMMPVYGEATFTVR